MATFFDSLDNALNKWKPVRYVAFIFFVLLGIGVAILFFVHINRCNRGKPDSWLWGAAVCSECKPDSIRTIHDTITKFLPSPPAAQAARKGTSQKNERKSNKTVARDNNGVVADDISNSIVIGGNNNAPINQTIGRVEQSLRAGTLDTIMNYFKAMNLEAHHKVDTVSISQQVDGENQKVFEQILERLKKQNYRISVGKAYGLEPGINMQYKKDGDFIEILIGDVRHVAF